MRNQTRIGFLLAIGLLWLTACGGDDDESASEQTANACASTCAKFELCNSATDESDCVEGCRSDLALAPAVFQIEAECAEESSCDQLVGAEFVDCIDDAISDLEPSNDGTAFCEDYAAAWETCDETVDETEIAELCQASAGAFTEDYIDALDPCLGDPCDAVAACFVEVADDFNTDYVVPFL